MRRPEVNTTFASCTSTIDHYVVAIPEDLSSRYQTGQRRLILVDTPGFGHVSLSNEEILRRMAVWLAPS